MHQAVPAVEFGRWAEVANVGSGNIDQLDDALHRAAREYLTSRRSFAASRRPDQQAGPGLLQEHRRLRDARDLYVIGAKCCAFLAWAVGDLSQLARLPRTAARLSLAGMPWPCPRPLQP